MTSLLQVYTERVLLWFDRDSGRLSIDVFDLTREQFDALPTAEPDHVLDGESVHYGPTWSREVTLPRTICLHVYTTKPPIKGKQP